MRPARRAYSLALAPLAAVALAGCTGSGSSQTAATTSSVPPGQITVQASDTACSLNTAAAPAGVVTFDVTNTGSKVTEFYVYAEGDRILGEVENIGPGLTRQLKVEVTEPVTLTTACKPGMVGDGIRNAFAITGTSVAGANEKVATAITDYKKYVTTQATELVNGTAAFVAAIKAKDVATAKSLYPSARAPWERIEPVAESFGDLDPKIDGREDVVNEGMAFTGYHRLEKDLWVDGLQPDSSAIADQLLADVNSVAQQAATVDITGVSIATGAKALLDEVATGKVTGEEERYSHTDLWDFDGNVQGSQAALAALRPLLQEKEPALLTALDTQFAALNKLLATHRQGANYVPYTDLTPDQVKALTVALDAVSEPVSRVAAVVEKA